METIKQKLGKVSITVDKDEHSIDKEYDKLVVVYKKTPYTETVDGETVTKYNYRTYISRKPVPIGTQITNKDYWIQLGSVEEHIVLDYETFKSEVNTFLNSFVDAENARVLAEDARVLAENTRVLQENTRVQAETTRNNNENTRQQQEGSPADEPSATGSRWARYKKAEQIRDSSYTNKEDNRDASYASSEQTRNDSYNTAESKRQLDYETNEGNKSLRPDPDGSRWEKYKQAEVDRENIFNSNEESRNRTFTASEQQRRTTFNNNEGTTNDSPSSTGSRWAIFKFNEASRQTAEQTRVTNENTRQTQETARQQAENQRTTTFNQSQTEREQAYQTAEGNSSDEPSATGSRWARYNKAEQDRNTAIEDLRESKANKDGYYSQLTAGAAETLVGQTVDSDAYLIRPTGGAENEVANGVASVLGMEGNSCVWNQTAQRITSGWTAQNAVLSDNKAIFTVTSSSIYLHYYIQPTSYGIIKDHKYYISLNVVFNFVGNPTYCGVNFGASGDGLFSGARNTDGYIKSIKTSTATLSANKSGALGIDYIGGKPQEGTTIEVSNVQLIDLTLLGIDNLTTVADVEAWLAKHVGTKPYYAYNEGTILSAQTLGIKTYGQNLLNPTTKQAKLIPYTWEENSNVYTIKNVPSGATATFTPDNTGVAESITITNNEFDITSYGSGILELSAATADTYVCMKWDEQKDDDVVPYEEHTQEFDVRKVYGKVSGAGEYVQCYPNGMRSAGSVHDTLTASEAVVKIGSVDMGTLTWNVISSPYGVFDAAISGKKLAAYNTRNSVCEKYVFNSNVYALSSQNAPDKAYCNRDRSSAIYLKDTSYSTAAAIKTSLNGVILYYELATPITYTDLIYRDGGVDRPLSDVLFNIEVNNWSIEEQLLTPYVNGNPTAVPATIKTQYGMDAVEEIDTIKHTYVSAYNEQNFSDSQKAQARRNIGAVEADGSYPNMSVGIAKNLAGENAVEAEYTYRQSGGTTGTNTGIANVTAVKGKTLKWQQYAKPLSSTDYLLVSNKASVSYGTNSVTITSTSDSSDLKGIYLLDIQLVSGHKYYISAYIDATHTANSGILSIRQTTSSANEIVAAVTTGTKGRVSAVGTCTNGTVLVLTISNATPTDNYAIFSDVMCIDLTEMGLDSITSVAEFEALYPLDYYAYTATPVLINNAASGIVTTGFNQWDEEWELGRWSDANGSKIPSNNNIRSSNYIRVIGGMTYNFKTPSLLRVCMYDINKTYMDIMTDGAWDGRTYQFPNNVAYITICTGNNTTTTYNHDICINLSDPAKNGTYEPYEKHTFYFDKVLQGEGSLATIKGKLNGEGESVVVFPDGLRKAGNVYDEIKGNVAIKRIGSVDLGSLTWSYDSTNKVFYSDVLGIVAYRFALITNCLCLKYSYIGSNYTGLGTFNTAVGSGDKLFCFYYSGTLSPRAVYFKDRELSSSSIGQDGKIAAMSGVILYYELATPETYILDQTVTGGYQVIALGTERRLPEDTASAVNAPVNYSVVYPIDAVGTITKLPINYISEKSLTNFTTELASKLGTFLNATIGISATYNQTTQEYDYTITITSNE